VPSPTPPQNIQWSVGHVSLGASGTTIARPGVGPRRGIELQDALWGPTEVSNLFARAAMAAFPGVYPQDVAWPLSRENGGSWTPLEQGRSAKLAQATLKEARAAQLAGGSSLSAGEVIQLGQLAARVAKVSDRDLASEDIIEKLREMARKGAFEQASGDYGARLNQGGLRERLRAARQSAGLPAVEPKTAPSAPRA
jgi:hypothetical protein